MHGTALRASGVSKSYAGMAALTNVALEVERGEIHALLGQNGSGKSTLIRLLAGVERADAGVLEVEDTQIRLDRLHSQESYAGGLRFIHQDLGLFPSLSVAENLSLGRGFETGIGGRIRWGRVRQRAARSLRSVDLDIPPKTSASALGPVQRSMLAIARALQDDRDGRSILVLDEPTASLPAQEVELLFDTLRRRTASGSTIIVVTHRLSEALSIADRVTVLRDGQSVGTFARADLDEGRLVELITGGSASDASTEKRRARGTVMLSVQGLRGPRSTTVSFDVRAGEIVGVAGLVGSGRTALLRTLFGALPPVAGHLAVAGTPFRFSSPREAIAEGVAYLPEDRRESLFADMNVRHNLSAGRVRDYWRRFRLRHRSEATAAKRAIARYGIVTRSEDVPVAWLSGGNQQKVVLARWLSNPRQRVLLLDEPTRGVDVGARKDLHRLIRAFVADRACALVASSDLDELAELCDRVLVLADGRIAAAVSQPLDAHRLTDAIFSASSPHSVQRSENGHPQSA